jgi:hypothetical protein
MPGNSSRRGAIKKSGKGNPTAGSGGRRRQGLEGKGPTPRAEDRPNHKIYKMKNATAKREQARPKRAKPGEGAEWVAGRNSVLELLRATVPVHALYVAEGTDRDEKIREIFKLAAEQHVSLLEIGRIELDKLTGGAVHQGIAAKLTRTTTRTPRTCSTSPPSATSRPSSWCSTASPTRATSARSSDRPRASVRTASSSPSVGPRRSPPLPGRRPPARPPACRWRESPT